MNGFFGIIVLVVFFSFSVRVFEVCFVWGCSCEFKCCNMVVVIDKFFGRRW